MTGINFSQWYCEQLGLDPWDTFQNLLTKLNPQIVRLSAYWNRIQPIEDIFDTSELDKFIDELIKKKIKIVLSVGVNAQRWPEYFVPSWLIKDINSPSDFQKALNKQESRIQNSLFSFIRNICERYSDKIDFWQVENEPFQATMPFNWVIGEELLKKEIAFVKDIVTKPVILNETIALNNIFAFLKEASGKLGLMKSVKGLSDVFAANIYVQASLNVLGIKMKLSQKGTAHLPKFQKIAVTELQAEPWPVPSISNLTIRNEMWNLLKAGDWSLIAQKSKGYGILATSGDNEPHLMKKSWNEVSKVKSWEFVLFWGAEYWWSRYLAKDEEWVKNYLNLNSK